MFEKLTERMLKKYRINMVKKLEKEKKQQEGYITMHSHVVDNHKGDNHVFIDNSRMQYHITKGRIEAIEYMLKELKGDKL